MTKIFLYMGTKDPDYRSLMREQSDLRLNGSLIPASSLVICDQTHSDLVHICKEEDSGAGLGDHPQIPVVDGLITNIVGQYLLIRTADCFPVMFYDEKRMVVAGVHSGRESTRKNIVGNCVEAMKTHYGSDPGDIVAYIGAGVCEDHYEVSEGIFQEFNQSLVDQGFSPCSQRYRHLNIRTTIFQQLIRAGLRFINIENNHECTFENHDYFSYRRDKGNNRQINIIGIAHE